MLISGPWDVQVQSVKRENHWYIILVVYHIQVYYELLFSMFKMYLGAISECGIPVGRHLKVHTAATF